MNMKSTNNNDYQWNSIFSFIMAMIGAVVGLGNIWRFSYVLYSNGGGAFFIPYFVAIILMGIPFMILEYGLGAKFKDALSNIFKDINPCFEIFGWMISFVIFLVLTYYLILIGWDLIYLVLSFFKGWGLNPDTYFVENIIVGSDNLSGLTKFVIPTLVASLFIWLLTWVISHHSLDKGLSKVVNIVMPLLFIMMLLIVGYALFLPGMGIGITALFTPNWNYLLDIHMWLAALGQTVFSLSIGQAILVTYASYLPENTKLTDNVLLVVIINFLFEVLTALGVFSILGYMSLRTGLHINEIATSGTGLLFVVFPEIFNIIGDIAYVIGPAFFICVFFAGITSILAFLEPLSLALSKKFKMSRKRTITLLCIIGFLISLLFTTQSGNYLLSMVDEFLNNFVIIVLIILQVLIFSWVYNLEELLPVLNEYSKIKVGSLWKNLVKYVMPIFLGVLLIMGINDILNSQTPNALYIQVILVVIIIVVPLILTILPSKDE